jgi:hypothetical protein
MQSSDIKIQLKQLKIDLNNKNSEFEKFKQKSSILEKKLF